MTVAVPNVAPSGPPPAGDPAESLADLLARLGDVPPSSKERLPQGRIPDAAVPQLVPDLAVEVLSEGNTKKEMARKRGECFDAGVRLVWVVDPEALTVAVYTGPEQATVLAKGQTLDGGDVLPGFTLPLTDLFSPIEGL
jgi:Uma2 family endonuclease